MKNSNTKAGHAGGLIVGLSALLLIITPHLSAQSVEGEGAQASPVEARATDQDLARKPSAPEESPEPWVRVEIFPRLLPKAWTPREAVFPRAAYVVHLDEQGRVVPPPPGGAARAPRSPAPQFVFTFVGTSAGGGIGSVVSHITSYSYAAVGPDGRLRSGCMQGSLEEVQAKVGVLAGEDESREDEATVKRETAQE